MDWRATTSQAAQEDLDGLFADSLKAAAVALAHQNFTPFMLVIERSGGRSFRELGAMVCSDENAVVGALQLDSDGSTLRARATVLDVTVRAPFTGDAIRVKLEHSEGVAIDMLVPYRAGDDGITVAVEESAGAAAVSSLWPNR
jgi:hypothetical protein